jgi:tetratricopeptide (TPR) repeat protein
MVADKLEKLHAMLAKQPSDAFLLYAIAMELKKLNEHTKAIEFLDRTIQADQNYCYAYYQRGQILESMGDAVAAAQTYNDGIAAAKRAGDAHAQGELETALAMIQ